MLKIDKYNIFISRGDTASLTFNFKDDIPEEGTTVIVALKRAPNSKDYVWRKELEVDDDGRATLTLDHNDTDFPAGKYMWDLRLVYNDTQDIYTPITPHEFNIIEVISDANTN